jgi:hypothetical protein
MGFYDEVIRPLMGSSGAMGEFGIQDTLQNAVQPYKQLLGGVEDYYGRPTAEMGPRGNLWQPGQPSAVQRPVGPAAPTAPQLPSEMQASTQQIPYYLQNPSQGQPPPAEQVRQPQGITDVAGSVTDIPSPDAVPPSGDPQKNEYESMVKQYLTRLMQPQEFPKPREMNWVEKAAILLNPEHGEQLREQFQGQDYKNKLMEYQANQQRMGQGAGLAEDLMRHEQDNRRHDADRAWFRESAMANSGSAFIPKGYQWKNPELEMTWKQKQQDRNDAHLRTEKYLQGIQAKPVTKEAALKDLFSEQARLQGQLLNPAAQQMLIMANAGVGDPAMVKMVQDMQSQIKKTSDKAAVIQAMDDADYAEFSKLDGVRQDQIIQEYLQALGSRQMPGSTSMTPMPSQPNQ